MSVKDERKTESRCLSRRDFLGKLSGAAVSMAFIASCEKASESKPAPPQPQTRAPRQKKPNAFVDSGGRPVLVCVTGTNFDDMLAAGLSTLEGLAKLIGPAQDVLIKPNCNASEPYPAVSSLNSLISLLKEVKKVSSGAVRVADQGYEDSASVYRNMGLDPAVENAGGTLVTLSATYRVRRSDWPSAKPDFLVYALVYNAPIIINACVLKRHNYAGYSCAIKNNVGAVEGPSALATRHYLHYESQDIMADVAEIAGLVNPELNIVDARSILTQGGPFYRNGVVVDAHKLVLCGDIVATDAYCAGILHSHDPGFSTASAAATINRAESLGMGTADLGKVQVIEIAA